MRTHVYSSANVSFYKYVLCTRAAEISNKNKIWFFQFRIIILLWIIISKDHINLENIWKLNFIISSLYNFDVFIPMLMNKINFYLFFCLSKMIFSFYDAVRDFCFWNLSIYFYFHNKSSFCMPCYNSLFLSVFFLFILHTIDQLLCWLSFYLFSCVPFILIRSISFRTFRQNMMEKQYQLETQIQIREYSMKISLQNNFIEYSMTISLQNNVIEWHVERGIIMKRKLNT